jgi:hypothetical protein
MFREVAGIHQGLVVQLRAGLSTNGEANGIHAVSASYKLARERQPDANSGLLNPMLTART